MSYNGHLHYAHEKFAVAVHLMATSDLPLRERLILARREFTPAMFFDGSFPERIARAMRQLHARMTWADGDEATMALVSDAEVRRLAQLVCDIDTDIQSAIRRREER